MTAYIARQPDANGFIDYTRLENSTWTTLYQRQVEIIEGRAAQSYLSGLDRLGLYEHRIPQLDEVSEVLQKYAGWSVHAVPALIPFEEFFRLLANKHFPVATFIRTPEELDYLQEPDIFHEIFGHCPMLTDSTFAEFVYEYGKIGLIANSLQRRYLARLFWYTVEFGLINENHDVKAYGAGILSSPGETVFATDLTNSANRHSFDLIQALRTPYRIDTYQKHYFIIDSYKQLFSLFDQDLLAIIDRAIAQGDFEKDVFEDNSVVALNHNNLEVGKNNLHDC